MKILHLAIEDKFVPFAQRVFEAAFPGENQFRIQRRSGVETSFIDPSPSVHFVSKKYWFSSRLKRDLRWADCVVIHFMTKWFARAVAIAPSHVLVAWHGWGADYYDLLDAYSDRLYLPFTSEFLSHTTLEARRAVGRIGVAFDRLWRLPGRMVFRSWQRRALKRLDVVSMLPDEFQMLKKAHPGVRAIHHQLYCSSAEESFLPGPPVMEGPDILLGNSAAPTNNHLDAFNVLRKLDLGDRAILAPLNYGDRDYAQEISRRGAKIFGKRFVPILDFLPAVEYQERIANCGFLFMNHVRQQATGNVSIGLLKGAKVFLRKENLLSSFYRRLGATTFDFPENVTQQDTANIFTGVSPNEKESNRRVVMQYWAMDTVIRQARLLSSVVPRRQALSS